MFTQFLSFLILVSRFVFGSTDVGASPSSFNEARCKVTQHIAQHIFTGLDFDGGSSSSMFDKASGGQLNIKSAHSKCFGSQGSMHLPFTK
jgi:hypothetical protein